MSRLNKANEIIELAILMQNSYCGLTIDEIADKFNCCRRSAERMKAVLTEKFPNKIEEVENFHDNKKRWRFKKGTMNWLINFSSSDFANLEMCKNLIKNPNKQKEIQEIIEKIKALTPDNISNVDIQELLYNQAYSVRQGFREDISLDILQIIHEGILSQKKIKAKYFDKNVLLNPYGIIYSDKLYLAAHNNWADKIWLYRISKLKEIKLTNDYFDKDEKFNIQDYTNKSFGIYQNEIFEVELLFKKEATPDVQEYYFHPTQTGKLNNDGTYTLKFKACGEYEIITELLKWRDSVKIIAPQKLKDEYNQTILAMVKNIKE